MNKQANQPKAWVRPQLVRLGKLSDVAGGAKSGNDGVPSMHLNS